MSICTTLGLAKVILTPCDTMEKFESVLNAILVTTGQYIESWTRNSPPQKNTAFFGVSRQCEQLLDICGPMGYGPKYLSDNDAGPPWMGDEDKKQHTFVKGVYVLPPEELPGSGVRVFIAVSSFSSCKSIAKQLEKLNVPLVGQDENCFYESLIMNDTAKYFAANLDSIRQAVANFYDRRSKFVYLTLLKARCVDRESASVLYGSIMEGGQYWALEEFKNIPNATFVDLGAFTGDTVAQFVQNNIDAGISRIHAFEAFPALYDELCENVRALAEEFSFDAGKIFCRQGVIGIKGKAPAGVTVHSLDDILDEPVHFIKSDIEGAEQDMLDGAAKLIQKYRPHLAISIYHTNEDMFAIPQKIRSLVPEYNMAVRHHLDRSNETVLYCWV